MSAVAEDVTRTRFLGAIAGTLSPDRVVEVHLFGAIRQGGMESGVAVIAVDPNEPAPREAVEDAPADDGAPDVAPGAPLEEPDSVDAVPSVESVLEEPVVQADGQVAEPADDAAPDPDGDAGDHAGYDAPVDETFADAPSVPRAPAPRYTIYTARYRHTLKGPDRGKWEASVTEEADAPLLTVDAVVRGVSRRSGEDDEAVRLSGEEFRAALPDPLPAPAVRALPIVRPNPAVRQPPAAKRA